MERVKRADTGRQAMTAMLATQEGRRAVVLGNSSLRSKTSQMSAICQRLPDHSAQHNTDQSGHVLRLLASTFVSNYACAVSTPQTSTCDVIVTATSTTAEFLNKKYSSPDRLASTLLTQVKLFQRPRPSEHIKFMRLLSSLWMLLLRYCINRKSVLPLLCALYHVAL